MKKLLFLSLFLAVSVLTYADNETSDDTTNGTTTTKTSSCHPENFSHWSIAIGGGANLMIGEKTVEHIEDAFGDYLNKNTNWAVKAEFEYMVNPVWGFNLQYMYDPYNKKNANAVGYTTDRDLQMHEVTLNFVMNILNIGRRTRVHTEWNWYASIGAGVLCFQRNQDYNYTIRPAGIISASTSVEYTPIPLLGIFAEGMWRWYGDDRVNGVVGEQMKDMGLYGGIGLRLHLGANSKPHVRTTNVETYEPLGYVAKAVNSDESCCDKVAAMQAQIDDLARQLKNMSNVPQTVGVRDSVLQAKVDSAVNAVMIDVSALSLNVSNVEKDEINTDENTAIYFDIDSYVISREYQLLLAQVARRLSNNNNERIVVRGYCDYRGTIPYNKTLAQKRIDAVVYILVNRFRIDKLRIATECVGRVDGEKEFDLLNRRCDIIFR